MARWRATQSAARFLFAAEKSSGKSVDDLAGALNFEPAYIVALKNLSLDKDIRVDHLVRIGAATDFPVFLLNREDPPSSVTAEKMRSAQASENHTPAGARIQAKIIMAALLKREREMMRLTHEDMSTLIEGNAANYINYEDAESDIDPPLLEIAFRAVGHSGSRLLVGTPAELAQEQSLEEILKGVPERDD